MKMATVNITVPKNDSKEIGIMVFEEEGRKWRPSERSFLIQLTLFVGLTGLLVAGVKTLKDSTIWDLEAWGACILVYVLPAGGILSKWAMDLLVFSVGSFEARNWKAAYVLVGLRKSGLVFIWVVMVLGAWLIVKSHWVKEGAGGKETIKALNYVTRALAGVLVGVILWMVKTLFMELLALNFIVERSEENINETKKEQQDLKCICDLILQPDAISLTSSGSSNPGGGRRVKKVLKHEYNAINENRRDWTPKFVIDEIIEIELPILVRKKEEEEEEEDIDEITEIGLPILVGKEEEEKEEKEKKEKGEDINPERFARVIANKLFDKIAEKCHSDSTSSDGQKKGTDKYIIMKENLENPNAKNLLKKLKKVIPPVRPFNKSAAKRFRKSDFRKWVVNVYLHRFVLLRTINGREDVLGDLNKIVSSIVLVIILIVWLIIMGLLTTQVMLLIATQLLALNFMFSDSARTVFEAILFVFVTKPFDVGHHITVEGQEMVVHEMNMLGTVFKVIGGEKVFYPNSVLMGKAITNLYFVPDSSDTLEFNIDLDTPQEQLDQLKAKIKEYLGKESKNWNPEKYSFVVDEEEYSDRNTKSLVLNVSHNIRFYNGGDRTKHRNELASEVRKYITELKSS